MTSLQRLPYLNWARANQGRQRLCIRGSGMPNRPWAELLHALELPLAPPGQDDLWHERQIAAAIAERQGTTPDRIFVTLGTSGANSAVLSYLLAEGGGMVCERPAYDPLWRAGKALGADVRFFARRPVDGWRVDPLALEAELEHDTRVIILARPHNPSGNAIPETELRAIGEMAEAHDVHVVVDEVYLDFLPGARPAHLLHPRLIGTASLTKVYGLGELRIGWVSAPPDIVASLIQRRLHAEALLPTPPLAMAMALWDRLDGWLVEARAQAAQGAAIFQRALGDLDGVCLSLDGGTPFGMAWWGGDEHQLVTALEEREVGVVPGNLFDAPGAIRIGWTRREEQLKEAAGILRDVLKERA